MMSVLLSLIVLPLISASPVSEGTGEHELIITTKAGFSVVRDPNLTLNKNFTEVIKVFAAQISYVNHSNESDLDIYVEKLNQQTQDIMPEAKEKIETGSEKIAKKVVSREMARQVKEEAESFDSANETIEVDGESSFLKRLYLTLKKGVLGNYVQSIDEYKEIQGKEAKIVINRTSIIQSNASPAQILDMIYVIQ